MDDQAFRKFGRNLRARIAGAYAAYASGRAARAAVSGETTPVYRAGAAGDGDAAQPLHLRRSIAAMFWAMAVVLVVYPVWAFIVSVVDDDFAFAPNTDANLRNQSSTIAAIAGLLDREVNQHHWTPNAPFFSPVALLSDMPNFQRGIVAELGRLTLALSQSGSAAELVSRVPDPDLSRAAELLQYPPDIWIWNPTVAFFSGSSEQQYRKAIDAIGDYTQHLSTRQVIFERTAETLAPILDSIAGNLGTASATIEAHLREHRDLSVDRTSGAVFYVVKGGLYADYIVLKGLAADFSAVLEVRGANKTWDAMMDSLQDAARIHPLVVLNGTSDSSFVPCHLCNEGFYLSRAREALRGLVESLRKTP